MNLKKKFQENNEITTDNNISMNIDFLSAYQKLTPYYVIITSL